MPPHKSRDGKTKNEKNKKNSSRSGEKTTQSRSRRRSEGSIQRSSTRTRTVAAGSVSQSAYPELGSPVDVDDLPVDSTIPRASRRPLSSRGYGPEEQQHIQRAVEGTDTRPSNIPEPVLDVLGSGGGQPLDQPIQRALEDRMEADFGNVRIHTGPKAAQAADAIDAKAFTCGNDVVFNSGEYDPESPDGQFLLAHELAHVKQQNGGATVSMMPQEGADLEIDPDPQLEREADQAAQQALSSDEPLVVNRMGTDVHIQRSAKGDSEYVTKGEVLEIVDNYYQGQIEEQARMDPLEQGETRETPQGSPDTANAGDSEEQSLLGRMKDAVTDNFGSEAGKRNIAEGTVAGTLAAGTIAATVLSGGTAIPAAAAATVATSTMAPALRGTVADTVSPQDGVPLTDEQLDEVAERVEKIRTEKDTGEDDNVAGSSRNNNGDR